MLIMCNNKGCLKSSTVLLNVTTNEVICQECGNPISNVSDSMKRTLKSFGQIVRSEEKKAFMVHCRHCNANREIVLNQQDETICKDCHNAVIVPPAFKLAMAEAGRKLEKIKTAQNPPENEE